MIDLGQFESCVCVRRGEPSESCADRFVLQEKGKKITLRPKQGERVKLLVLDGCIFKDTRSKCDGIFFFEKGNSTYIILVELKGGDIDHAFEQIKFARENRQIYSDLRNQLGQDRSGKVCEDTFVISNHRLDKVSHQSWKRLMEYELKRCFILRQLHHCLI